MREGRQTETSAYVPAWYGSSAGSGSGFATAGGRGTAGLFSSGAVPNFAGMFAALSTIGSAPSSSSSGGSSGGGFSGASSSGGGGSGGGF